VLDGLLRLVDDAVALHCRLIILTGATSNDRSALLAHLGTARNLPVLNLGVELGRQLLPMPRKQRPLQAANTLRMVLDAAAPLHAPILLDRAEVMFDCSLQLDPLEAFKRLAHARTVVVNWPGELRDGRLVYAPPQHPEHRDSTAAGTVTYHIH